MPRPFEASLAFGDEATDWIAAQMRADGWAILRLNQLPPERAGPASARQWGIVVPDIQAVKRARTIGVEVKRKSRPVYGKLTQELEHGIDLDKYDAYRNYERHNYPTFLVIVESPPSHDLWSTRPPVWAIRVSDIGAHPSHGGGMPPMAYWPRRQMSSDWLLRLNRHIIQAEWPAARERRDRRNDDPPTLWDMP